MSMWKTIPTLFGDLADRPDAADVPYGTGWVDENGGLSISDGTTWTDVGGGGAVAVDDDGTPVIAAASTLNFGDNLTVTDDGGGQVTIDATGGGGGGAAYCETVGDGTTTSFDITHNLGSTCVVVSAAEIGSGDGLVHGTDFTWLILDADTVRVVFTSAPATDDVEITVLASGGTSGGGGSELEVIHDSTLASNGDEWDVSGISTDFDLFRLTLIWSSTTSGNFPGFRINNDSGSNYHRQQWGRDTANRTGDQTRSDVPFLLAASIPSTSRAVSVATIYKPSSSEVAAGSTRSFVLPQREVGGCTYEWRNTSAKVSRVQVFGISDDTLTAGSRLIIEAGTEPSPGRLAHLAIGL